ncbi:hypothetical protein SAMN02745108_02859 [Fibrobacter intestinalis]|uniref:Uncharacterized protein n=1 Tax=Fibrobacter intestinalis TaxID=28122 RepID=A0A1T4RUQ3_9BACT|nr:hypothetical protein SAMN02745108_02859 [Fibrobacter intestinalis]
MSTPGNLTNGNTASLTLRYNDRSAFASLSSTRLVNTSRLWLTGHVDFFGEADLLEGFAEHAAACVAWKMETVRLTPHSRQHDSLIRVAYGSQGTPIDLETNGTVRDARGFTSIM